MCSKSLKTLSYFHGVVDHEGGQDGVAQSVTLLGEKSLKCAKYPLDSTNFENGNKTFHSEARKVESLVLSRSYPTLSSPSRGRRVTDSTICAGRVVSRSSSCGTAVCTARWICGVRNHFIFPHNVLLSHCYDQNLPLLTSSQSQ